MVSSVGGLFHFKPCGHAERVLANLKIRKFENVVPLGFVRPRASRVKRFSRATPSSVLPVAHATLQRPCLAGRGRAIHRVADYHTRNAPLFSLGFKAKSDLSFNRGHWMPRTLTRDEHVDVSN
jgi:hypothetical protein